MAAAAEGGEEAGQVVVEETAVAVDTGAEEVAEEVVEKGEGGEDEEGEGEGEGAVTGVDAEEENDEGKGEVVEEGEAAEEGKGEAVEEGKGEEEGATDATGKSAEENDVTDAAEEATDPAAADPAAQTAESTTTGQAEAVASPQAPAAAASQDLGSRKLSFASTQVLGTLEELEERVADIEARTDEIEVNIQGEESVHGLLALKAEVAQLFGNADRIQCMGLDAVGTQDLVTGKTVAKDKRKALNRQVTALLDRLRAIGHDLAEKTALAEEEMPELESPAKNSPGKKGGGGTAAPAKRSSGAASTTTTDDDAQPPRQRKRGCCLS